MAVFKWIGGSVGLDQGRFKDASDWDGPAGTVSVVVPQTGDTADIIGVVNAGIYRLGALYEFPVGGGYPLIEFFPAQDPNLLLTDPNAAVGDTVQGVTFTIDGTAGAVSLWLENSQLLNDTFDLTGTTVLSAYLDDTVTGTINVGTATTSGFLETELIPYDSANVGPSDHDPVTTFNATVNIAAKSTVVFEAATGTVSGVISNGTINVQPGGTFIVDDTDNPNAATDTSGVDFAFNHNLLMGNGGTIGVEGAPGLATTAVFLADVSGPGVINVNGNGAAPTATTLRIDGYLQNQTVTLTDGTILVNDASTSIDVASGAGFDITGGSFTFGDRNGTLMLHQAPLTSLQFNADDTGMIEVPNGRMPFTTPIHGFGPGDVIAFPGKYLGAFGETYDTAYNAATGNLQVQSPAGLAGNPADILASLNLVGDYNPALFQLTGTATTEELDLTYTGNPAVSPATADLNGDGKSDILWQNTNGSVDEWTINGPAVSSAAIAAAVDPSWRFLGTGDFNGDGKSDILWQNTNGSVDEWTMNGAAVSSAAVVATVDPSWTFLGTGDFNGDGKSDILWRNTSGSLDEWTMNGAAVSSAAVVAAVDPSWTFLGTGDFNGDGKSDILWRNTSGSLDEWTMNGASVTSTSIAGTQDSSWTFLGIGDFNGDGKSDMLWQDTAGAIQEWTMNGANVISKAAVTTLDSTWKFLAIGDVNGDFKSDILWQNSAGTVVDWTMNGSTATGGFVLGSAYSSWRVLA